MNILESRGRALNHERISAKSVVYWMSRDMRVHDNWALLAAQELALTLKQPLEVVFSLLPIIPNATRQHYQFLLLGLAEIEKELKENSIPFSVLIGDPTTTLPDYCRKGIGALIVDFSPLKPGRIWRERVAQKTPTAVWEVDAHNCIPAWITSDKQEYAARTIRPKIEALLPNYLTTFPSLKLHPLLPKEKIRTNDWTAIIQSVRSPVTHQHLTSLPGEKAAKETLRLFLEQKLRSYEETRNDPTLDGQSHLSPYLHYGQIAAQRIVLEVMKWKAPGRIKTPFLEELIVRKELAENFCFYSPSYDECKGFPGWAKKTLDVHRKDPRPYLYSLEQFAEGKTHDPLWNAAQKQMLITGAMHGYMRMYWAKKILEWTKSPEIAVHIAITLNDTYALDGRDPNGYTGIAWAIGGVHDRPWAERPIFGTIRYMSARGAQAKFPAADYCHKWNTYEKTSR